MPNRSTSAATDSEKPSTANFDAAYAAQWAYPITPGHRADVDDLPRPLPPHDRQHGAHDVHHAVEVRCKLAL